MTIRSTVISVVALAAFSTPFSVASAKSSHGDAESVHELEFRVLLDEKEIGFHRYELRNTGEKRVITSEASFDVKFLFVNAYRYRHNLTSEWQGGCLESLQAETNADGKQLSVNGRKTNGAFVVEQENRVDELASCVMNFAYWDPAILQQDKLLNPQTGEYLDVDVHLLDETTLQVRGEDCDAKAYRIVAKDMRIDVWYSADDNQWLALESLAKGGRIVRYELV